MWIDSVVGWFTAPANALAVAQLVAAFVTALATIALWQVTRVLAVETKTLAAMTARPFVVCILESSEASAIALNLTLRNTGNATAFDVLLELSPALEKPNGNPPDDPTKTTWKISLLPPGQSLTTQGVLSTKVFQYVFEAKISWASAPGSSVRESLSYTFEPKDGFRGGWATKGLHDIAGELEKIRNKLPKP